MNRILKLSVNQVAIFLIFIFLSFAKTTFSQEFIELLEGAEKIELDGKKGNYIITGNVIFKKDETKFFCDSAYFNNTNNTVKAYGNIHLNKMDTLNMFCDSLFYDVNTELVKLFSKVRVRNNEYKLETDSLDYDLKNDIGIYRKNGIITNIANNDKITSEIGYFYPKTEQFNFRKHVIYEGDVYRMTTDTLQFNSSENKTFFFGPTFLESDSIQMYCEKGWYDLNDDRGVLQNNAYVQENSYYIAADSLYYSAKDEIYIAQKKVEIRDTVNKISFFGDFAISKQQENFAFITGHALVRQAGEDTLYIHADTLFNYTDSTNKPKLMLAYNNVKLFRGEMQGICDSLNYSKEKEVMNLYKNPVLWVRSAQLSGDTITVYEKNNEIERAFVRKQGLIVTHVDSTNYYNQIAGTQMTAYFDSSEIKKVTIDANAKTIYFLEETNENDTTIVVERKGMNRLYASNVVLRFKGGDIETATFINAPDGLLYPMKNIDKKEELVEYFKWEIKSRPKSWQSLIYSDNEQKIILNIYRNILYYLLNQSRSISFKSKE